MLPYDALELLTFQYGHQPDYLAANLVGILGKAADIAPLTYRIHHDVDLILGEPSQGLALRVLESAHQAETVADHNRRTACQTVFGLLSETVGRNESPVSFYRRLDDIILLKHIDPASLTDHQRRRLVLFDIRVRVAAGSYFRGFCERFGEAPAPKYVHPELYDLYFIDSALDALGG